MKCVFTPTEFTNDSAWAGVTVTSDAVDAVTILVGEDAALAVGVAVAVGVGEAVTRGAAVGADAAAEATIDGCAATGTPPVLEPPLHAATVAEAQSAVSSFTRTTPRGSPIIRIASQTQLASIDRPLSVKHTAGSTGY